MLPIAQKNSQSQLKNTSSKAPIDKKKLNVSP